MIKFSQKKVLLLHQLITEETGGDPGLRDFGLLDSALEGAYATFDGVDLYPTKEEKAARLGYALISNHAFVDGNKRTAFAACSVFLQINGHGMRADSDWLYAAIIRWLQLPPSERFSTMLTDLRTITE